jgi:hypothetical protein
VAFTKAFGTVFLGEPRKALAASAQECGWPMRGAMLVLAATCSTVGLAGFLLLSPLRAVLASFRSAQSSASAAVLSEVTWPLAWVSLGAGVLLTLIAALSLLRRRLLRNRSVGTALTWDCGYARPEVRMQYTASSFVQPLTALFRPVLRTVEGIARPTGILPKQAEAATTTSDICATHGYRPLSERLVAALAGLRWLQHGKVQLYVLYIALTLLALLLWKLR